MKKLLLVLVPVLFVCMVAQADVYAQPYEWEEEAEEMRDLAANARDAFDAKLAQGDGEAAIEDAQNHLCSLVADQSENGDALTEHENDSVSTSGGEAEMRLNMAAWDLKDAVDIWDFQATPCAAAGLVLYAEGSFEAAYWKFQGARDWWNVGKADLRYAELRAGYSITSSLEGIDCITDALTTGDCVICGEDCEGGGGGGMP